MAEAAGKAAMLLLEPETLLRRTVALTARSLGLAQVHEAASTALARRLLKSQVFNGAVIAIDREQADGAPSLELIDELRRGETASNAAIPIAVMVERCDAALLMALRERGVGRIILKAFRARALLDTFAEFEAARLLPAAPVLPYRSE